MDYKNTSPKTVLLLIPNVGFGGAERVFYDHSIELGKRFNVIECVFNTEGKQVYVSGNQFISLEVTGGGGIFTKVKNFYLRCVRLKAIKKQYKVDTCISHLEGADYINLLTKGKEKVILCIHGSKLHDENIAGPIGWLRKKILMPLLYNRADKIVTVSRDINAELVDNFGVKPDRVQTINNFFDLDKIRGLALEPLEPQYEELFKQNLILITSGRLAIQKNQLSLIEVFSSLKKINSGAKLVLIGDGELRSLLISGAKEQGLKVFETWEGKPISSDFDVYFLGYQSNPFKFLANADLFVFPSAWEGFPMALSEAMICGLPVVSADCPTGPREILAPEVTPSNPIEAVEFAAFGILMPMLKSGSPNYATNRNAWVMILSEILQDSQILKYYKGQSKIRVQDFSRDKIISSWESLLDS